MKRRGFLLGLGALLAAPSIVKADSLMKLSTLNPILWGDGIHDDTNALNHYLKKAKESYLLPSGIYRVTDTIRVPDSIAFIGNKSVIKNEGPQGTLLIEKSNSIIDSVTLQNMGIETGAIDNVALSNVTIIGADIALSCKTPLSDICNVTVEVAEGSRTKILPPHDYNDFSVR